MASDDVAGRVRRGRISAPVAPVRRNRVRARITVRWVVAPVMAAVWCWAVADVVARPDEVRPLEATIAAGGWGLSLLPVQCVPQSASHGGIRAWRRRWRPAASDPPRTGGLPGETPGGVT